jgi:hypothetical protein
VLLPSAETVLGLAPKDDVLALGAPGAKVTVAFRVLAPKVA